MPQQVPFRARHCPENFSNVDLLKKVQKFINFISFFELGPGTVLKTLNSPRLFFIQLTILLIPHSPAPIPNEEVTGIHVMLGLNSLSFWCYCFCRCLMEIAHLGILSQYITKIGVTSVCASCVPEYTNFLSVHSISVQFQIKTNTVFIAHFFITDSPNLEKCLVIQHCIFLNKRVKEKSFALTF